MADKKISQLATATTPLAGTEVVPIVQGGSTVKVPVNSLFENASSTKTGVLSSTDWTMFNSKQPAGSYAVTNAGQTFSGTQNFTGQINATYGLVSWAGGLASTTSPLTYFAAENSNDTVAVEIRQGRYNKDNLVITTNQTMAGGQALIRASENGVERFVAYGSGDVAVTGGNIYMQTAGKGIDFSATAGTGTSELLADYEEGNWYPTFTSGGSSFVYQGYSGTYTKIGNVVYVRGWISVQSATASATQLKIGGLPYTAGTGGHATSISYANSAVINSTSTNLPTMYLTGTTLDFYKTDGNAFNGTDASNINGINMYFGATYTV